MIEPFELTVVLPTFNRLKLLQKSINSLEAQSVKGFVVIILDNNSDDGTSKYLSNLRSSTFKLNVVHRKQNIGYFKNLLDGIDRVQTKYITFLSDDNIYFPNCLQKLLASISETDDVRLGIGSHNLMSHDGEILRIATKLNNSKYGRKSKLHTTLSNDSIRKLQLQKKIVAIDSAIFVTKQLKAAAALEQHGLDYTLFSQYIILGGNARYISDSIMNYRKNPEGISQDPKNQIAFANYVIDSCNCVITNNNLNSFEITWLSNEIFRYKFILVKHGLIKPGELLKFFRWNRNLQCYRMLLKLPIISLMRKFN